MDGRKSLLSFIVMKEEDRNKLLDINVLRVQEGNLRPSLRDNKNKMLEWVDWESGGHREVVLNRVSELREVICKTEYENKLKQRWERVRGR